MRLIRPRRIHHFLTPRDDAHRVSRATVSLAQLARHDDIGARPGLQSRQGVQTRRIRDRRSLDAFCPLSGDQLGATGRRDRYDVRRGRTACAQQHRG